jgi:hypothetical protein
LEWKNNKKLFYVILDELKMKKYFSKINVLSKFKYFHLNKYILAGHSKWSKICHKKAINDNNRSKEFAKMCKVIIFKKIGYFCNCIILKF